MDSDLAEAVQALKTIFDKRQLDATFAPNDAPVVADLRKKLGLTIRYAAFLKGADPVDVETVTPSERVRFIPAADLEQEQRIYLEGDGDEPPVEGWRKAWVVIARSALLGDPYFLDIGRPDAEGDCAVYTAMSGTGLKPVLCASSFASFVQILATAMEVAEGFADEAMDPDDEAIFRETLSPKIRVIDQAALREGHWT